MIPSIGKEIRYNRKLKGLTQLELAELARTTEQTINYLENDKRTPSIALLEDLAAALEMTLSIRFVEKSIALDDSLWKKLLNG